MKKDDYITHVKYGLCQYKGLYKLTVGKEQIDCCVLEPAVNSKTKIYVPRSIINDRLRENMTPKEAYAYLDSLRYRKVKWVSNYLKRKARRQVLLNEDSISSKIELIIDLSTGLNLQHVQDKPIASEDEALYKRLVKLLSEEIAYAINQKSDLVVKIISGILANRTDRISKKV